MNAPSLRRRLRWVILGGAAAFALIAGIVVHVACRMQLEREAADGLRARCAALSAMLKWEHGRIEDELDRSALPEFYAPGAKAWFRCTTADGQMVAHSPGAPLTGPVPMELAGLRITTRSFTPAPADDDDRHEPIAPLLTLTVAIDAAQIDHALLVLALVLAVTAVCGLSLVPWMAGFAVDRLLAPLSAVGEFAERLRPEDLDHRISLVGIPSELIPVCERLNALAARMIEALVGERRFAGDIAHELRTPLAELRALSELALTWPAAIGDPVTHHGKVQASALRMEAIVASLLTLYRHEAGLIQTRAEHMDLSQQLGQAWESFASAALAKRLQVKMADAVVPIHCDREALGMVARNLLANAVEYTPVGGAITTSISTAPIELQIVNTTKDLTPDDIAHLGERFWRKDRVREASGHCGLGLALSRAMCRSLGLELSFNVMESGDLRVVLRGFRDEQHPDAGH